MLNIEQVHQNNLVAKEFLLQIIKTNKKIAMDRENERKFFKSLSLLKKIEMVFFLVLSGVFSASSAAKIGARQDFIYLEKGLKNYFKMHYQYAGLISKHYSPELSIKHYSYGIVYNDIWTLTLKDVPFPMHR